MLIKNKIIGQLLRKNERLHDKRHPMFERNRFVKFLAYFMIAYYGAILLLLGVSLPASMSKVYHGVAGFHLLDGWFFILLMVDFWLRFIFQETPANQTRPYSLLPISRRYMMRRYMMRAAFSSGNLFWAFFLVPFGLLSVYQSMTLWATLGWWLGWWLLFVMNSYAYLLIRALCTRHFAWFLAPLLLHVAVLLIALLPEHNPIDMPCTLFMFAFAKWQMWPIFAVAVFIWFLYKANATVQGSILYDEVGRKDEVVITKSRQMTFLNRFGIVGEYLKLELRMKTRNRMLKVQMLVLLGCMLLLSGILYFSEIYDGLFMRSFICLYDYIVPGATALVTIMCHEGNYMDLLMSRHESLLDLLTAKYYFFSALLLFPFLLLIPVCLTGKITFLMSLGYLFFVVGVVYPCLFQMAAFNKETLPLNAKLASKQGNGKQNIVTLTIMFLPIAIERASVAFLGNTWGYITLIIIGTLGIATHRQWLRFTYRQFVKHRYENMEGFRASRK